MNHCVSLFLLILTHNHGPGSTTDIVLSALVLLDGHTVLSVSDSLQVYLHGITGGNRITFTPLSSLWARPVRGQSSHGGSVSIFLPWSLHGLQEHLKMIDKPDFTVGLTTDADVGVLLSKDWFEWADESKLPTAGTCLIFRLRSEVAYKVNYHSVAVAVDALVRDHLRSLVKVACVDFEHDKSQGNPVVASLQRHGSVKSVPMSLTTEYHLTLDSNSSLYGTPSTNESYLKVSGDFNPIHTKPYFAAFASLPGIITHGMFTSVATRQYTETVIAKGIPDCVFK